jgi:ABC-2 type transport system ATP-binding protein
MPQLFVLYPDLTAKENVEFMAALFGIPPWRRGDRVRKVLDLVDLTEARDRRASALSGGMQRRLELACALVHQPRLLILDEPTAGIDPLLRTRVWQELERLRATGVTVIVTTQYVTEAEYCDAVALISEGQLVGFAPPQELRRQALGGEMIEVGTGAPFDASSLPPIEGIVAVTQRGPSDLLFVAQEAGVATPRVNDAIEMAGGTVAFSREYRPTFDEVFATLVRRHAEQRQQLAAQPPTPADLQAA